MSSELLTSLHVSYIQNLGKARATPVLVLLLGSMMFFRAPMTSHTTSLRIFRLNAIYWGLTALCVMGHPEALDREEVIRFVESCWNNEAGGFGAHPAHDAHLLPTLSAIQILVTYDALDRLDIPRVVKFILSLQQPSGVFAGDSFGEIDTRFSYSAVNALSLLGCLDQLDRDKTVDYIKQCRNFDGGFGSYIGAESHAMQGPEKLEDVCYSFWVLSALSILDKVAWIDSEKLTSFILSAQDTEKGGIADRPGDMVDVFHTVFGVAGLSILGYPALVDLDPVYCMPARLIEMKGLKKGWKALERRQT
ncbi:rab geranylgeranyltransferase [Mycena rebaudengoi]|nr:rab geranylgeranyltransferase [Mycena rebaudengoi]